MFTKLFCTITEDKAVFEGMNNIVHEYFCEKLGKYRLYPFEPLPLPYEYFTVHNSSLPSSSTFQDIGTSSQHQNPSNLGTLANFMNSLTLDKQKTSKVVDIIKIGSNRREVSALPCTFNYYTIYVVPVIEFDGALLFLQNGSSSPMPLGIIVPILRFSEIINIRASKVFYNLFVSQKFSKKNIIN